MKLISTSLVFLLATTSNLSANWSFSMSSDQKTCIATSEMESKSGWGNDFKLEFQKAKAKDKQLEMIVYVDGRRNDRTYQFDIPGTTTAAPLLKIDQRGDKKTYKAISMNTANVMKKLSVGSLELKEPYPNNAKVRAIVASNNFNEVMNQMSKVCNNGESLIDSSFEETLTNNTNRYIDMRTFEDRTLIEAMNLSDLAYKVFSQGKDNQEEVNQLVRKFQAELNLKSNLEREISDLDSRKIPQTINDQVANNKRLSDSQQELKEVNQALPNLKKAMDGAKSVRDRKESAVAPLRAEHNQKQADANNARNHVNQLKSQLSNLNNELRSAQGSLSSLQNEKNRLYGQIDSDQYQLRRAEDDLQNAEYAYRRYDEEAEYRQNLIRLGHSRAIGELRRAQRNAQRTERLEDQARSNDRAATQAKKQAQASLRQCQVNPPQEGCGKLVSLVQERVAESNAAERKLKRAKDMNRSAESDLRSAQYRVNNIEDQARRDAQEISRALIADVNRAQNEVNDLRGRIDSAYSRINNIDNREIPSVERTISSLERQIPQVQRDLSSEGPRADRLERDFAQFKQRVQWDAKVSALQAAQTDLDRKSSTYNSSLQRQAALESTISFSQKEISRLANLLASQKARSAQAKSELAAVKQELQPYDTERAKLDQKANQINADLQNKSAQYTSMLNI